jgi:hypothetical protein
MTLTNVGWLLAGWVASSVVLAGAWSWLRRDARRSRDNGRVRRIILVLAAVMAFPAAAHAGAVLDAGALSEDRWEAIVDYRPCGGQIIYRFEELDPGRIGRAVFYDRAAREEFGVVCRVELAERHRRFLYARPALLCSVVLHEVGHLSGRGHSDNPRSVMFPEVSVDRRCKRGGG